MTELAALSLLLSFVGSLVLACFSSLHRRYKRNRRTSIDGFALQLRASWPPVRLLARRITVHLAPKPVSSEPILRRNGFWFILTCMLRWLALLLSTFVECECAELRVFPAQPAIVDATGDRLAEPQVCVRELALQFSELGSAKLTWSSLDGAIPLPREGEPVRTAVHVGPTRLHGTLLHMHKQLLGLRLETKGAQVPLLLTIAPHSGLPTSSDRQDARPARLVVRTHLGISAVLQQVRGTAHAPLHAGVNSGPRAAEIRAPHLERSAVSSPLRWMPEHVRLSAVSGSTVHVVVVEACCQRPGESPQPSRVSMDSTSVERQVVAVRSWSLSVDAPIPSFPAFPGTTSSGPLAPPPLPVAVGLSFAGLRVQVCPCIAPMWLLGTARGAAGVSGSGPLSEGSAAGVKAPVSVSGAAPQTSSASPSWEALITPTVTVDAEDTELRLRISGLPRSIALPVPAVANACGVHHAHAHDWTTARAAASAASLETPHHMSRALWIFHAKRLHAAAVKSVLKDSMLTHHASINDVSLSIQVRSLTGQERACGMEQPCWHRPFAVVHTHASKLLPHALPTEHGSTNPPATGGTSPVRRETCWSIASVTKISTSTQNEDGIDVARLSVSDSQVQWTPAVHVFALLTLAHHGRKFSAAAHLHLSSSTGSTGGHHSGVAPALAHQESLSNRFSKVRWVLQAERCVFVASCGLADQSPSLWAYTDSVLVSSEKQPPAAAGEEPLQPHTPVLEAVVNRFICGGASLSAFTLTASGIPFVLSLQAGQTRQLSAEAAQGATLHGCTIECWGSVKHCSMAVSNCLQRGCSSSGTRHVECTLSDSLLAFPGTTLSPTSATSSAGSSCASLVPGRLFHGLQASYKAVASVAKSLHSSALVRHAGPAGSYPHTTTRSLNELSQPSDTEGAPAAGVPNMAIHMQLKVNHGRLLCMALNFLHERDGREETRDANSGGHPACDMAVLSLSCDTLALSVYHNSSSSHAANGAVHDRASCLARLRRAEAHDASSDTLCACNNPHEHGWASTYAADISLETLGLQCTLAHILSSSVISDPLNHLRRDGASAEPALQAARTAFNGTVTLTELRPRRDHLVPVALGLTGPCSSSSASVPGAGMACLTLLGHRLCTPVGLYPPYLYIDGSLHADSGKAVYSPAIASQLRLASAALVRLVPSGTAGQGPAQPAMALSWWDRLRLHLSAQVTSTFEQCSLELSPLESINGVCVVDGVPHTSEGVTTNGQGAQDEQALQGESRGQRAHKYVLLSAQKVTLTVDRRTRELTLLTEGSTLHVLQRGHSAVSARREEAPLQPVLRSPGSLHCCLSPTWLYHARQQFDNARESTMIQRAGQLSRFPALAVHGVMSTDTDALLPVRACGLELAVTINGASAVGSTAVVEPHVSVCSSLRHMSDAFLVLLSATRSPPPVPVLDAVTGVPIHRASLGALISTLAVTVKECSVVATLWGDGHSTAAWMVSLSSASLHGRFARPVLLPVTFSAPTSEACPIDRQRTTFSGFRTAVLLAVGSSLRVQLSALEVALSSAASADTQTENGIGSDDGPTVLWIPCVAVRAGTEHASTDVPLLEAFPPCRDGASSCVNGVDMRSPSTQSTTSGHTPEWKRHGPRPLMTGNTRAQCPAISSLLSSCQDGQPLIAQEGNGHQQLSCSGTEPAVGHGAVVTICGARIKWSVPVRDQLQLLLLAISQVQSEIASVRAAQGRPHAAAVDTCTQADSAVAPEPTPAAPLKIVLHRTQVAMIALNPHRSIRSAMLACISDVSVTGLHSVLEGPVVHVPVAESQLERARDKGGSRSRSASGDSMADAAPSDNASLYSTASSSASSPVQGVGGPSRPDPVAGEGDSARGDSSHSPAGSSPMTQRHMRTHMRQWVIQASGLVGCTLPEDDVDLPSLGSEDDELALVNGDEEGDKGGEGFAHDAAGGSVEAMQGGDDSPAEGTGVSGCEGYAVHWLKDRAGTSLSGHGLRGAGRISMLSTSGYAQCLPFLDPCQASLTWTREWQQVDGIASARQPVESRIHERQAQHLYMPDAGLSMTSAQFFTVLDVMKRLLLAHSPTKAAHSAMLQAEATGGSNAAYLARLARPLPVSAALSSVDTVSAAATGVSGPAWKQMRNSIKNFVQEQRYGGSSGASPLLDRAGVEGGPGTLSARSVHGSEWSSPPMRRLGYTLSALRWTLAQNSGPTVTSWEQLEDPLTWVTLPPPPSASPLASKRMKMAASALAAVQQQQEAQGQGGSAAGAGAAQPVSRSAALRTTTYRSHPETGWLTSTTGPGHSAEPHPSQLTGSGSDDGYALDRVGDGSAASAHTARNAGSMSRPIPRKGPIQVQVTGVDGWHEYWPQGSTRVSMAVRTVRILRTGTAHGKLLTGSPMASFTSPSASGTSSRVASTTTGWHGPPPPSLAQRSGFRHTRQASTASTLPHVLLQVQPILPAIGGTTLGMGMGGSARAIQPHWAPPHFLRLTAQTLPPVFFPYLPPSPPVFLPLMAKSGVEVAAPVPGLLAPASAYTSTGDTAEQAVPAADAHSAAHGHTVHTCRVNVYHRLDVELLGSGLLSANGVADDEEGEEAYQSLQARVAGNKAVAPRSSAGDTDECPDAADTSAQDDWTNAESQGVDGSSSIAHPAGGAARSTRMGSVLNALRNMAPLGPGTGAYVSPRRRSSSVEAVDVDGSGGRLAHAVGTTRTFAKAARLFWKSSRGRSPTALQSSYAATVESSASAQSSAAAGPAARTQLPGQAGPYPHPPSAVVAPGPQSTAGGPGPAKLRAASPLSDAAQLIVQVQRADVDEMLAYFAEPTVEEEDGDGEDREGSVATCTDDWSLVDTSGPGERPTGRGGLRTVQDTSSAVGGHDEIDTSSAAVGASTDLPGQGPGLPVVDDPLVLDEGASSDGDVVSGMRPGASEVGQTQQVVAMAAASGVDSTVGDASKPIASLKSRADRAADKTRADSETTTSLRSKRGRKALRAAVAVSTAVRGALGIPAAKAPSGRRLNPAPSHSGRPVIPEFHFFNSVRVSGLRASLSARGFWGLSLDSFALSVHPLALRPKVLTWKDLVRKGRRHAGRELLRAAPRLVRKVMQKTVSVALSSAAKAGARGVAAAAAAVIRPQSKV